MPDASAKTSLAPLQVIESMTEKDLDALPYGAIQLNTMGKVLKYNAYEARLSGLAKEDVLGKNFFKEVAPCTDVKEFYGRFLEGVNKRNLHCKFRYHFSFRRNPIDVTVTLFLSERDGTVWVYVQPLSAKNDARK
jgi:photoactive yellow protein